MSSIETKLAAVDLVDRYIAGLCEKTGSHVVGPVVHDVQGAVLVCQVNLQRGNEIKPTEIKMQVTQR